MLIAVAANVNISGNWFCSFKFWVVSVDVIIGVYLVVGSWLVFVEGSGEVVVVGVEVTKGRLV